MPTTMTGGISPEKASMRQASATAPKLKLASSVYSTGRSWPGTGFAGVATQARYHCPLDFATKSWEWELAMVKGPRSSKDGAPGWSMFPGVYARRGVIAACYGGRE